MAVKIVKSLVLALGISSNFALLVKGQSNTCPGFPGFCSESFPGHTCVVVCSRGRPNVPLCQDDLTWTDVPRCIEHEPGDLRQIPGVCPGISGYCSQGYLGQACEFPCPSGPTINSTCTIDGTWFPYPTCLGDIRETQDGCNPCPGPSGARRNRPIESPTQRFPVNPTAQLDPTDRAPRPTFAGTKSFGTSISESAVSSRPQPTGQTRPVSPRLQGQNFAVNSQGFSAGQFQTQRPLQPPPSQQQQQQQQQQEQPRSFGSSGFNALANFPSLQGNKQPARNFGPSSSQASQFANPSSQEQTQTSNFGVAAQASSNRNSPQLGSQFGNFPAQSRLNSQTQESRTTIAQAPLPPLPSSASTQPSNTGRENSKVNPLRARQSRPSPQTSQPRAQVQQQQQQRQQQLPQVSSQPQQFAVPTSSNGGIPLSQGRFVVGSDGSIDARRKGQQANPVQLTNEERSILRTSLPSATASKVRSQDENAQRQAFESAAPNSRQNSAPANVFDDSPFSSAAFNDRSPTGSVRDREVSFGPFQVVNL